MQSIDPSPNLGDEQNADIREITWAGFKPSTPRVEALFNVSFPSAELGFERGENKRLLDFGRRQPRKNATDLRPDSWIGALPFSEKCKSSHKRRAAINSAFQRGN